MNAQEFVSKHLSPAPEYPFEPDREARDLAARSGLVVVFGASDDLCELRGAIYDEVGCYDGGEFFVTPTGKRVQMDSELDEALDLCEERLGSRLVLPTLHKIKAVWGETAPDGRACSWHYVTEIPHASFDIVEDGELYCIGIVFALSDLTAGGEA